jgi:16S rRNA (guanine(966)-N(2))-methyltransferase RsmD
MRVIAGSAKGRKLKSPGDATRPITDRVKENLFNILRYEVIDATVLDLYAGAGSVGIEALSRGAKFATFVERDPVALRVITENLQLTKLAKQARIVREDVFKFINRFPEFPFDLIYVAPPQYRDLWWKTMHSMDGRPFLSSRGVLVAQIHPKEYRELELMSFEISDQRKYGSTMLLFYKLKRTDDSPAR